MSKEKIQNLETLIKINKLRVEGLHKAITQVNDIELREDLLIEFICFLDANNAILKTLAGQTVK